MREAIMLVIAILVGCASFRYCRTLLHTDKKCQPVLTTWLLFAFSGGLLMWTYFHTHEANLIAYSGVIIGYIDCIATITLVLWLGGRKVRFETAHIFCLVGSLGIAVWWYISRDSEWANLWLQAIMCVAYVPTYKKLWQSSRNTEDLKSWTLRISASALAVVLAVLSVDPLAFIAASRSVINGGIILLLVYRIHRRRAQLPTGSPA